MKKLILLILFFIMAGIPLHAETNVKAKDVSVNSSSFNKNLSPADSTVQKALNTIDQMAGGGGGSGPGGVPGNIQTNAGGGVFGAYAGGTCGGQAANAISASGALSCITVLTLTGLSAISPITYNNTTGSIGWTNSQNYITLTSLNSTMAGLTYNNATGQFSLTAGYYFPTTTDQTAWNAKQAAGNYITALTGDLTAAGPGSVPGTLATVNSNVGTFQGITVNGKGLVTGATNQNYLTGNQTITLSGDLTGSGTTSIPGTLATVNSNVGTFQGLTINGKGLVTAATNQNYLTSDLWTSSGGNVYRSSGNVGVGSATPGQVLDVQGTTRSLNFSGPGTGLTGTAPGLTAGNVTTNANLTGPITSVGNATSVGAQTGTGSTFVMQAGNPNFTGNVGIGSTAPGQKLDVQGTGRFTNVNVTALTPSLPVFTDINKNLISAFLAGNTNVLSTASGSSTAGDCPKYDSSGNLIDSGAPCGTGTPGGVTGAIQVNSTGSFAGYSGFVFNGTNMGIGSIAPGQTLDIQGTVRTTNFILSTAPASGYVLTSNGVGVGSWQPATSGGTLTSGSNMLFGNGSGGFTNVTNTAVSGGNVGLGTTTNLNAILEVNGNVGIGTFSAINQAIVVQGSIQSQGTTNNSYLNANGGNVGIGSTNPGQLLDVQGTLRSIGGIVKGNVGIGTSALQTALAVTNGNVGIGTWTAGGGALIVSSGVGNVGIGTAWPGQVLDVQGIVRTTGFILSGNTAGNGNVLVSNAIGVGTWMPPSTIGAGGGGSSQWTTTGSDIYFNGGNVGIGSSTPTFLANATSLNLVDNSKNVGMLIKSTAGLAAYVLSADTTIKTPFTNYDDNHSGADVTFGSINLDRTSNIVTGAVRNDFEMYTVAGSGSHLILGTEGIARIIISSTGNVGIGTISPTQGFQIGTDAADSSGFVMCIGSGNCAGKCTGSINTSTGACSTCTCLAK